MFTHACMRIPYTLTHVCMHIERGSSGIVKHSFVGKLSNMLNFF